VEWVLGMNKDKFLVFIKSLDLSKDENFRCMIEEASKRYTIRELAQIFDTSLPIIERWRSGKAGPYPSMRYVIKDIMIDFSTEKRKHQRFYTEEGYEYSLLDNWN
jgi:hypothetical protein